MNCENCPCLEESGLICLAVSDPDLFGYFCTWPLKSDSGDEHESKRRHIVTRSRIGATGILPAPMIAAPIPSAGPFLGDMIEILARRIGADRATAWISSKLGVDCGCAARRAALNRLDEKLRQFLRLN